MSLKRPNIKPKNSRRGEDEGEIHIPFLIVYDPTMRASGGFWRWDTGKKEKRKSSPGYSTRSMTKWVWLWARQQKIKKEKKERKRFNEEMLNKINSNRNGKLFHLPAHPQNTFENRLTLPKGNNEKRTTYGLINRSCKAKRGEECK